MVWLMREPVCLPLSALFCCVQISFGFSREVTSTRTAYLFNIRQSSLKVLDGSSADSTVEESCLDMYFVEEDGSTFKASHLFHPYLLIHVKGNSTIYGEVEQFLLNKYAAQIVKCEQYQREDLDMVRERSGGRGRDGAWRGLGEGQAACARTVCRG